MDNKTTFGKLLRVVSEHIGLGGNSAHPDVDEWLSGFMTPDMLRTLRESTGLTKWTEPENGEKTSVFDLPFGRHQGIAENYTDCPISTGFIFIDVLESGDRTRKSVTIYHQNTGKMWHKIKRTDSTDTMIPNEWGKIVKEHNLWTGKAASKGDVIDIQDDLSKFLTFEFYYSFLGNMQSQKVTYNSVVNGFQFWSGNLANDATSTAVTFAEVSLKKTDTGKITIQSTKGNWTELTGTASVVTDKIEIFKVVGYI